MSFTQILGCLLVAHALADYPLQGDFLSKAKNRFAPIVGVPWYQAMGAHAMIQAGFVGIITGSIGLAIAEFAAHFVTDYLKCAQRISFNTDQAIHIACKIAWAYIAVNP